MLWLEKYRPHSLDDVTSHPETVSILRAYTLESVPNLVFHGQAGHNKKTLAYCLIAHLYGEYPELKQKSIEMKINSTTQTVSYLESNEVVEICPSEYGIRDRHVVQSIIKEMAQARPVLGMFGVAKRSIKILIIDRAEDLSRDAQAALRRTMEIYSGHCRIFMLCSEVSRLIEPIRSRSLFIRVRGFTDDEIAVICESVTKKEAVRAEKHVIDGICANANGSCKRALCVLELYCFNREDKENKRQKTDLAGFRLEWEDKIEAIVGLIKNRPAPESFGAIRKEFYALLTSCVPPGTILLELARRLCKTNFDLARGMASAALLYEERLLHGSKHLLHLEAFAAAAMALFAARK